MKKNSLVYLVGAGPGLASLMTLRGKEALEQADVLIYDALVNPVFLSWVKESCEKIYVGKRSGNHALSQEEINALLVKKGKAGGVIVRLKGGDPYVFGRGGEEVMALKAAKIAFEVVPGVTSAIGGLSYAGIPVTDREYASQFTVMTGHEDKDKEETALDYKTLAALPGTKVILMGRKNLEEITSQLQKAGQAKTTPAALVQWAATPKQRTLVATLGTLAKEAREQCFEAPCVIAVGDVVKRRKELSWYEKLPLFGKKIVVTRTREQASVLSEKLGALGADVLELPTIKTVPPTDKMAFAEGVVHAHSYGWLVFSSPTGVKKFFEAFFAVYPDIRSIGGVKIAAIGQATADKIAQYGLAVDVMPKKAVAEDLLLAFDDYCKEKNACLSHETILWVHGEKARRVIYEGLFARQAIVDECIAYNTVPETELEPSLKEGWSEQSFDMITFTSASTVENFFALGLAVPSSCALASIGPVTSEQLDKLGKKASLTAKKHDIEGLVEAIVKYFS